MRSIMRSFATLGGCTDAPKKWEMVKSVRQSSVIPTTSRKHLSVSYANKTGSNVKSNGMEDNPHPIPESSASAFPTETLRGIRTYLNDIGTKGNEVSSTQLAHFQMTLQPGVEILPPFKFPNKSKIQKLITDSFNEGGVFAELDKKNFEIEYAHLIYGDKRKFGKNIELSRLILKKLTSLLKSPTADQNIMDRFYLSICIFINSKLLHARFSTSESSIIASCNHRSLYGTLIRAYVHSTQFPINVDKLYKEISEMIYALYGTGHISKYDGMIGSEWVSDEIDEFKLSDIPLNPNVKLSRLHCLKAFELSENSTEEEIKTQYKRLCLKYHPDKNLENTEAAKEMFIRVQIVASTLNVFKK